MVGNRSAAAQRGIWVSTFEEGEKGVFMYVCLGNDKNEQEQDQTGQISKRLRVRGLTVPVHLEYPSMLSPYPCRLCFDPVIWTA